MNAENDLAQLLKAHKSKMRVGDKRLADMANAYAGIPLVNRSSIRNWSDGSAKGVRDCRALVAIAGALRLTKSEVNDLLAAGECPDLASVFAANPDSTKLFSWWGLGELTDESEDSAPMVELVADETDLAESTTSDDQQSGAMSQFDDTGRLLGPTPSANDAAMPRVRGPLVAGAALAALVGVVLVSAFVFFVWRDPSAGDTSADPDAPPVSAILAPVQDSIVGEALTASGTASHPAGVSHVELVLVDMERNIYWNPHDEVWQQKWRVFSVPVTGDDVTDARWETKLGDPLPLLPGKYRLRVWARSLTNRGDPIGPLVEFEVTEHLNTRDETAFERAQEMQNNPVPDPATEIDATGEAPKSRSEYPWHGSSVLDGFRLLSTAEYEPGLEFMTVELQDATAGEYWNFEAQRWQTSETTLVLAADDADCGPCTELVYDTWMPAGSTPPGDYVVTTRAVGADGATNPEGNTAEFTVIGP